MRGVNWAPDSYEEDEGEDEDPTAESEVQFVPDTYAGESEVLDTQVEIANVDEPDAVHALESFASKFESDKIKHEGCSLMLPVLFPRLYGDHHEDVNDAAVSLLWMSRGYCNVSNGLPRIPEESQSMEMKIEEVKRSIFKIVFLFMYEN